MRASLQRLLHALIGRNPAGPQDREIGNLPSIRRRRSWARSVEQLLESASRYRAASHVAHPEWEAPMLLRTEVVRACEAELLAIKGALLDQRQPISAQALQQLKRFLLDAGTRRCSVPTQRRLGEPPGNCCGASPDA